MVKKVQSECDRTFEKIVDLRFGTLSLRPHSFLKGQAKARNLISSGTKISLTNRIIEFESSRLISERARGSIVGTILIVSINKYFITAFHLNSTRRAEIRQPILPISVIFQ